MKVGNSWMSESSIWKVAMIDGTVVSSLGLHHRGDKEVIVTYACEIVMNIIVSERSFFVHVWNLYFHKNMVIIFTVSKKRPRRMH